MATWPERIRTWTLDAGRPLPPLVAAPMAGGPSCPALATAVARTGAIGYLAAGYLTPEALAAQVDRVAAEGLPVAVNIFLPDADPPGAPAAVQRYAEHLEPLANRLGVALDPTVAPTDDFFREKVEMLARRRVALASFTFACPERSMVEMLQSAGTAVVATVTSIDEARAAAAAGVDAICAQGTEAGGHRATFDQTVPAPATRTIDLVDQVVGEVDVPIIAAGGVADRDDVGALLRAGATAVQVGTALLRADEAGTSATHRSALAGFTDRETVLTRAYSGRQARGISNRFITDFTASAPTCYPRINTLTRSIRAAAATDPEVINLWAGTGFAAARPGPAAEILRTLRP